MMNSLPTIIQSRLQNYSVKDQEAFVLEYKRRKKSIFTGYLLLLFLGWHYAYLNKWGYQILCFFTLWGFLIWWVIDWFRLPFMVKRYNRELAIDLFDKIFK